MGEKSVDQASLKMLNKAAQEGIETAWDRYEKQQPQCGFGLLGICCRNCNMGPCRIDPFGDEPQEGVCGATADTIAARNLLRMIAAVQLLIRIMEEISLQPFMKQLQVRHRAIRSKMRENCVP